MAFLVEDGTGLANSTSYASEAALVDYIDDRGYTAPAVSGTNYEEALVRATKSLDAKYRGRFPGYKAKFRAQALEWPRLSAYDADDNLIASDAVPIEIVQATCELAIRELAEAGSALPDLERGGSVRRLQAGSVEIEYGADAKPQTVFQLIDGILSAILTSGSGGGLFGTSVRG